MSSPNDPQVDEPVFDGSSSRPGPHHTTPPPAGRPDSAGSTYTDRVIHGMHRLNQREPGWEQRVELALLDVGSSDLCVVGQVFGDYEGGLKALGIEEDDAWMFGFNISPEDGDYVCVQITEAWKSQLAVIAATSSPSPAA